VKQAIEAFNSGMVLIIVFIGSLRSEINERPVNAAEESRVLPEDFVIKTKTIKVTSGARDVFEFASLASI
jgi:hypothetical protein